MQGPSVSGITAVITGKMQHLDRLQNSGDVSVVHRIMDSYTGRTKHAL